MWPSDLSEEVKAVSIDSVDLPIRVYNMLLRGFKERFGYLPQTVGDIIEKLTPRGIIDLADYHNPLGEKSVEQLTEAFAGIGVVLQPND